MTAASDSVEAALRDAESLRRALRRGTAAQVRSADEKALVRATAMAWFNNHRENAADRLPADDLAELNEAYAELLAASERSTARSTFQSALQRLRQLLIAARGTVLMPPARPPVATSDAPPSFASLIGDPAMQGVLARRWTECSSCLSAGAPLAATVMMGGLLEGLLLAKVNSQPNMARVFTASAAPKDRRSGNPLPLSEWTLKNYIDVAHELGWISRSARDVGGVLRDYRNYVHPQKELSHGVALADSDAVVLWEVSKTIARELL